MMVHNAFLCILALSLGFAIGSPSPLQTLGLDDNERRLQQGQGNSGDVCANPEELFYNIFFTLNDSNEKATGNCTEDDYVIMGLLIQDIVKQIDEDFPKYRNEFIDTSVCAVPAWSFGESSENHGNTSRTLLEEVGERTHRRLNTYTYVAGGRCRRCTTGRRVLFEEVNDYVHRRLQIYPHKSSGRSRGETTGGLAGLWSTEIEPTASPVGANLGSLTGRSRSSGANATSLAASQAANAACDMASTAQLALSVCETGNATCRDIVNDIAGFLREQKGLAKIAKEGKAIAEEKCDLITDSLQDVGSASREADRACTEAKIQAGLPNKDAAVQEMLSADAASKNAGDIAMKVQDLYAEARQVKHDIMKEIMLRDFEVRDQMLKKLVEDEEREYQHITEEIQSEIEHLEREIAKQTNKQEEEKARLKAEALKERLVLQQRKHAELASAMTTWTADVTDAHAFAKMMDEYSYELTTAINMDEWLEEYRNLLQQAVPKFLYDWYNTTGAGCLNPSFKGDFIVTVELAEVAGRNETLSEKCESPDFTHRS